MIIAIPSFNVFAANSADGVLTAEADGVYTVIEDGSTPVKYTFKAPETKTYYFYSTGDFDTKCDLYESNMYVGYDDDSGEKDNFCVTYECIQGRTYTLETSLYNNATGSFDVYVSENIPSGYRVSVKYFVNGKLNAYSPVVCNQDSTESHLYPFTIPDNVLITGWFFTNLKDEDYTVVEKTTKSIKIKIKDYVNEIDINVVPADHEHIYETSVVAPHCAARGYTAHTCKICGFDYYDNYVARDSKNHIRDDGTVTKNPTTTEKGIRTFTCKYCRCNMGTEEIDMLPKSANTLAVKAKTATVKLSKLKKKNQTVALNKVLTVRNAKGKVTYAKSSGNKKITINKTTGKVTVKKGLKKGTYKVKVKVSAAGNNDYKPGAKTVTLKIKVK
jgi:hypothetical protein